MRVVTLILCVALAAALASCGGKPSCDMDAQGRRFSTADAKDCGRATPTATDTVNACVKAALASGVAFRARYDLPGLDSSPAVVFLRDGHGKMTDMSWDSDPGGGSQDGARLVLWSCDSLSLEPSTDGTGVQRYECSKSTPLQVVCDRGVVVSP